MSETPSATYSMTQAHTSESEQCLSPRPLNVTEPVVAKRVCFYKSGDPQFNGVKMVVNGRSFKSFDALLDNLSRRVPLPFGVRTITTPRGIHGITNLEDLEDGKSYICSQQKKIKPINLEMASKKPLPWQISRPVSVRRKAVQLARESEDGMLQRGGNVRISTPKKLLVFKNGDVRIRRTIVLGKKNTQNFEAFLDHVSELMHYPVVKLYTTDGRKVPNLQALILCSGTVVAAGREPFRPGNYDPHRYSLPGRLPGNSNRVYPKTNAKSEGRKSSSSRSQIFSTSSYKGYTNDNDSAFSYAPDNDLGLVENNSYASEDLIVAPSDDDIEKSVHLNQDGSMTVEMRVRFKIKEEQTIKWTTTVSRAGFLTDGNVEAASSAVIAEDQSSELNILTCKNMVGECNKAEEDVAEQQISEEMDNQGLETCSYDIWQNPSMNIDSENDKMKPPFHRPPTPGPRKLRKKKALVESVTMVSDTAVQKKTVGQFSFSEETDTGETKSEYCLVTHSSNKTSNVNNLKLSKTPSNQVPKRSFEDEGEEEMLTKEYCQTTMERSANLLSEDGLPQNILEKSATEKRLHNYITSDCGLDINHVECSPRNYDASKEILANRNDALGTTQNHSECSQSTREEIIGSQQHKLSHGSIHCSPSKSDQTAFSCERTSTTMAESTSTANNSSTECITTHISDGSQVTSSSSKKKKKKKKSSSDIRGQGGHSHHRLHNVPMEGTVENRAKACEMHITKDATLYPSSQITVRKRGLECLVHNSDGTYSLDAKEDLHSQVSMKHQQTESNVKQNRTSQLPKVKLKLDKKINVLPSQEDLLLGKHYPKSETSGGSHNSNNIKMQIPFGIAPLVPLNESGSGCKEETEKRKSSKTSTKHKKVNKNKKMERSPESRAKVSDESCTMDAFRHANETAEYSLESYVLNWLQNAFPRAVTPAKNLAPSNSSDRTMHSLSDTSFSDKENQLERKNVTLVDKNNISEGKLSNSTFSHLNETEILEKPIKDFHESHTGYLTDAEARIIDDTKPDIHHNTKQSACDIVHTNDREDTPLENDGQCLSDNQRYRAEIANQADLKAIDRVLGTNGQIDCVSSLLLHQLKSAVLSFEKSHIDKVEKSRCLTGISPSLFGSSSDLLLAWLLVQNFKESLSSMNNDDINQTTRNFAEIVTLQQYLKQLIAKEEAKDQKDHFSDLQESTGNHLLVSGMQTKAQELIYCQEKTFSVDTENTSDFEAQGKLNKTLNSNDRLNSEEITHANKLTEELARSSKSQENCSTLTVNPNLDGLDNHYTLQDLNCGDVHQSHSCGLTSNEELPKEKNGTSVQESLDRNIDTSFNNEESGLTEEPRSTTPSLTSNDNDHIFDLETSEVEDNYLKSIDPQECAESAQKEEKSDEHLSLTAENAAENGSNKNSVQEFQEESGAVEEPSVQLSAPSPISSCHESKQTAVDTSAEEPVSRVKLMVKELECGSYSNSPSTFRRCFKNSADSDLSHYPPDSEISEYNYMASSDLTSGSAEEAMYEKEYNTGFVKRTIERLYGKTEVPLKPVSNLGPPYMSPVTARDTEEPFQSAMEEAPSLHQASASLSNKKVSAVASHEIPEEINTSSNILEEENFTWPAPQFSLNGDEVYYNEESSVQCTNEYCQPKDHTAEDEGVLIDKGKWLLKENHLIRRSPPDNLGMYGNIETTSADTVADNHNDDIPYSHFGNLDPQPQLKEISSPETEDIVKPFGGGCSYFNMPCNSESEPFLDEQSIKSKHSHHGSILPVEATRRECSTPTQPCTDANTNSPSFRSVEFKLPDNKVHPLEQASHEEVHSTQPTSNALPNRTRHEDQDSLDKLHAICGQHCPILMALVKPANEEIRGCAYRKASDIENHLGLYFLTNPLNLRWQGKDVSKFDSKHGDLKNSCINTIANNILNRFYTENTLDFMNENNFGLVMSTTLQERKSFKKSHARENMDVDAGELNNHETKNQFKEITLDQYHDVSLCQNTRSGVNQMAGVETVPLFPDLGEGCENENFYYYNTFLNNNNQNAAINFEDANTISITEETHSHVPEEESSIDNSTVIVILWNFIYIQINIQIIQKYTDTYR